MDISQTLKICRVVKLLRHRTVQTSAKMNEQLSSKFSIHSFITLAIESCLDHFKHYNRSSSSSTDCTVAVQKENAEAL